MKLETDRDAIITGTILGLIIVLLLTGGVALLRAAGYR